MCAHQWLVKERCLFSFLMSPKKLGATKQISRGHPKVSLPAESTQPIPRAEDQPLLVSTQSRIPQAPHTLNLRGKIILTVIVYLGQHSSPRKTPAWKCEMLGSAEGGWQMLCSLWMSPSLKWKGNTESCPMYPGTPLQFSWKKEPNESKRSDLPSPSYICTRLITMQQQIVLLFP